MSHRRLQSNLVIVALATNKTYSAPMSNDSLVHVVRPAAADPEGAIVLFHGRGSHEHDLFPLLDILDPQGRLVGATVRAPLELPPAGFHWYITRQLGHPDRQTFSQSYSMLEKWLGDFEQTTGIAMSRTFLGGFSQGAVMTYAMGLGKGRPRPAGLLPFSGFMPQVDGFELDFSKCSGMPVAIGHGFLDQVIGVEWSRQAKERLEEAGAAVTYRESPMAHGIDPSFLATLEDWLTKTIS